MTATLAPAAEAQTGGTNLSRIQITDIEPSGRSVTVQFAGAAEPPPAGGRLLLTSGDTPFAWCAYVGPAGAAARFAATGADDLPPDLSGLAGWWVGPRLIGDLLPQWPAEAEFLGEIDSAGPGTRTVWIRRGSHDGVAIGDCWWLRAGGQPAARFDVLLVEPELCFCQARPLVADAPIRPGERVALWPAPGLRRRGEAVSGVTFIDRTGDHARIWVAWPRGIALPDEPHLEFLRSGRYIGHAIADRRDDRFWYARPIQGASAEDVRVGDEVRIRTTTDVEQRRFVARVFEIGAEGALITAGEEDGLTAGQECGLYRDGALLTMAAVRRVQREYCVLTSPTDTSVPQPALLDEVRFAPADPGVPRVVGVVEHVVAETLIRVRSSGSIPLPLGAPLAVREGGRVVAVAVLVANAGDRAIGFLPSAALTTAISPGATLEVAP